MALGALLTLSACGPKAEVSTVNFPQASPRGMAAAKALSAPYNGGDPVAGREVFALCVECHSLVLGGSQPKGPSLHGVFGRTAGTREGYTYSEVLKASGIVWDARHLDQWMFNPHETLPGTSMNFIGIRNDKKRRDLLAYLVALSADAAP
jgi:cytochrome c